LIRRDKERRLGVKDDELQTDLPKRLKRARRRVRKHVKFGVSLVEELIAERRAAARDREKKES
jgi:hypothetical protein